MIADWTSFLMHVCEAFGALAATFLLLMAAQYIYLAIVSLLSTRAGNASGLPHRLPGGELPRILIQIPVFNESALIERTLRSVAVVEWPRDRLEIQLLDDSTDETSVRAGPILQELRDAGFTVAHLRRPHREGYKAGALAAGLLQSSAPVVAVLDADFVVPPDWLMKTVPQLMDDPGLAFVQSRLQFIGPRDNLFVRIQQMLFDAQHMVEQHARSVRGMPVNFRGTGGVWRRAAIEAAGGWKADTLTEDLDLSLRAHIAGWRGALAYEPPTTGEVPAVLQDWIRQQGRWAKGVMECARNLLTAVWRQRWSLEAKFFTTLMVAAPLALPAILISLVGFVISVAGRGELGPVHQLLLATALAFVAALVAGLTLPAYRRLGRGSLGGWLICALALVPLMIYRACLNTPMVWEALLRQRTPFVRTPKSGYAFDAHDRSLAGRPAD